MNLTSEERQRFFDYALEQAQQEEAIARQMEKVGMPMFRIQKAKAIAWATVSAELDPAKWETFTVGGEG